MTTVIEIVKSVITEDVRKVIAECNVYDDKDVMVRQCSRSPFTFAPDATDEQIIEALRNGDYAQYFATEQDEL